MIGKQIWLFSTINNEIEHVGFLLNTIFLFMNFDYIKIENFIIYYCNLNVTIKSKVLNVTIKIKQIL